MCFYNMQDGITSLTFDTDFIKRMSATFNSNLSKFVTRGLFSWDCALTINKIELEFPKDVGMIRGYESDITGEITRIICHYGEVKMNSCLNMMKQKKVHQYNMLILTTITDGLYRNYLLMLDLTMSKIYQCLRMILS